MNNPTLVIMAAGMGSRYGTLKQIDGVDEFNHIIMDFSIYDAIAAGFEKVVFIIKKEHEQLFKDVIGTRMSKKVQVEYAFQDINNIPEGFSVPADRVKPWGTAHAILSCENVVNEPFAVINADDYYGPDAFAKMSEFLSTVKDDEKLRYAMVGYRLANTLTENGYVSRGICTVADGNLQQVVERTRIEQKGDGVAFSLDEGATWEPLNKDDIVSMNLWGFTPSVFAAIREGFAAFLEKGLKENPLKCEYYLPSVVSRLLEEDKATVKMLTTDEKWFGVTYAEDKKVVVEAIQNMKNEGKYPQELWDGRQEALNAFKFTAKAKSSLRYGSGHINDTFVVNLVDGSRVILQRINTNIFRDPEALMQNITSVTEFLRNKIVARGGEPERETLNVIKTKDDKNFFVDSFGGYWRSYIFIEKATSYDRVENKEQFYQSAVSFGAFQGLLADFPAETLSETIKDFHNTLVRFETFEKALKEDVCDRAKLVKDEIEFFLSRKEIAQKMGDFINNKTLPLRVTHNDTKLNNIMIDDATNEGICVIDLDTVMPGFAMNDFGDSIRFGASTASEDEKDLSKVSVDVELFELYTKGFILGCGGKLTQEEILLLPFGAKCMTFECGMRFLTDYLQGDVYFKTHREGHNLDRARTQITLVKDMEEKQELLDSIIKKYI